MYTTASGLWELNLGFKVCISCFPPLGHLTNSPYMFMQDTHQESTNHEYCINVAYEFFFQKRLFFFFLFLFKYLQIGNQRGSVRLGQILATPPPQNKGRWSYTLKWAPLLTLLQHPRGGAPSSLAWGTR